MPANRGGKKRRKPRNDGWVPQHHGAWAMIIVPTIAGMMIGGPHWRHIPLLLLWWVGYFFFYAATLWLKAHRKQRFFPPVRAYGLATLALGIIVLLSAPWLAMWALWFAPLIAISLWCVLRKAERSLLNDFVTIIAACLMTMVTFDAAHRPDYWWFSAVYDPAGKVYDQPWGPSASWAGGDITAQAWAWRVAAVLLVYFLGTVPHVKALIRERDNPRFAYGSVLYHVLALIGAIVIVVAGWWPGGIAGALLIAAAVIAAVRAAYMPWRQNHHGRLTVKQIGKTELYLSILVAVAVLLVC